MKKTLVFISFFLLGILISWLSIILFIPKMNIEIAFLITVSIGTIFAVASLFLKHNK